MTVQTKNFATLVEDQVAAMQSRARALIDFTTGSILKAVVEANASAALWLESLALQVLSRTRASTSNGPDLDSFVGDYGLTREGAVSSAVIVTFARFTNTASAVVPVGAQVQTTDGTQTFTVVEDDTNPAWSAPSQGYVVNSGISSVDVPVVAAAGGAAGNVTAGSIGLLLSAIPHIDTVTNAAAASGGADAETDPELRIRFRAYLASLASATPTAIGAAIAGVQVGLTYNIGENLSIAGQPYPGHLMIYVDDGSGAPGPTLLAAVTVAVDHVRAAGITFSVQGPTLITATVVFAIQTAPDYHHADIVTQVVAALTTFINGLELGETLYFNRLYQVIYDAAPGIDDVTALTLNGGGADIIATYGQVVRTTSVTGS